MENFVSTAYFSPKHSFFLAQIAQHKEPRTFARAVLDPQWILAMNKELDALESNNTWELVTLPLGKQTIGCKWVFKIKYLANSEIDRYKVRLFAKGYTQQPSVDFHDTFSPVAKGVNVKSVMAITTSKNWSIYQLDIKNAFLHGDLLEEVYMDIPLGYQIDVHAQGLVKAALHENFSIKDLGQAKYYLGLEISQNDEGLVSVTVIGEVVLSHAGQLQAKKQSVTSKSTIKAEYRALAAVEIANNPFQHARIKPIELDCHFIREKIQAGIISPQRISTKDQLADIFTKALRVCGGSNRPTTTSAVATTIYLKAQHKASVNHALVSQVDKHLIGCIWT
ncbi:uncharacterized protein LOC141696098 [Apium graveolens]|uniref:uncharacterized protein LOC141696098 n=1 Tax=Apium graveolens TaxID=4045 RepID=UPI003D7BB15C